MDKQRVYLEKLFETIKLLAAPAEIQLAAFPDEVCKPDEIALTYDEFACKVDDCQLLSEVEKSKIKAINNLFDTNISNEEWTEEAIANSEKWMQIRNMSLELLKIMKIPYSDPNLFWIKDAN